MGSFRSVLVAILFAVGVALLGLSQLPSGPALPRAHAANHNVTIGSGGQFSPSTLTIKQGDTVTFVNSTGSVQSATADLGGTDPNYWKTGFIYGGQSVCAKALGASSCFTFPNTGTFSYYNNNQAVPYPTGTIIVEAPSGGGGGSTATATATSGGGGGGGNVNVTIGAGGVFSPSTLTITAGTTVTFVNSTATVQSATSHLGGTDPNYFRTGFIYGGQSVCAKPLSGGACFTFPNAGTYTYYNSNQATPYPTGTIIVEPSSGGGGPTNTPPPATSTNTPSAPPTNTPLPTQTPGGPTATPTATATSTPTLAPGQPTNTPSPTPTRTPTVPPGPQPTATPNSGPPGPSGFPAMGSGWNLVLYYGTAGPPANVLSALGTKYTVVYYWNGKSFERFVRPGTAPGYLNTLTWMAPGNAYWIFLTNAVP
jgi:plastocyanin